MSTQPTLTPEQLAWQCPACERRGRRGYCAPNQCVCGDQECHAFASYVARKPPAMPENVHPLIPWKEAG